MMAKFAFVHRSLFAMADQHRVIATARRDFYEIVIKKRPHYNQRPFGHVVDIPTYTPTPNTAIVSGAVPRRSIGRGHFFSS